MAYELDGKTTDFQTSAVLTTGPITLSIWVYLNALGVSQRPITITSETGNDRFSLVIGVTNTLNMQVTSGGANSTRNSGIVLTTGTWYHLAGTWSTATNNPFLAYVDGVTNGTANSNRTPTAANLKETRIGSTYINSVLTQFLDGKVAEAAIWDTVLTGDEINSIAKGFRSNLIRPQNLVFYAPLIRDLVDVRGKLTLTNNDATVTEHVRRIG